MERSMGREFTTIIQEESTKVSGVMIKSMVMV